MNKMFFDKVLKSVFLFLLCFGLMTILLVAEYEKEIAQLSNDIALKIEASGKKKVAVVDFTDLNANTTELGRFIAEEFSIALSGAGKKFTVIDRTHLKTLLQEHKLSTTGLIDQQTARQLGKIAGVEILITGTLTPLGESVRVGVKVLDTETAEIIDAKGGNIALTGAIKNLLEREISTSTPQKQEPIQLARKITGKTNQSCEIEGIIFEVAECKRVGNKVICSILVTSKDNDKKLSIRWKDTNFYDEYGNKYSVKSFQSGSDKIENLPLIWTNDILTGKPFLADVPTKLNFTFENISPQVTLGTAMVIECFDYSSYKEFFAKIRNIPITNK